MKKRPEPLNLAIAARLRAVRHTLSLTQEEMAGVLGVTRAQISNIEAGGRGMTIKGAVALSSRYGISVEWLLKGDAALLRRDLADQLIARADQLERTAA